MVERQTIYILEYYDPCDGWSSQGLFSTKEKAEAYRDAMKKDEIYEGVEDSEFRIDWMRLDPEYD